MTIKPGNIIKPVMYYRSINVGDLIFADNSKLKHTMEELRLQGRWLVKSFAVEKELTNKIKKLTDDLKDCKCKSNIAIIGREQRENQELKIEIAKLKQ